MRLYLVRHWETVDNKNWIYQWHNPWKLSDTGILQAQKLAERLKNETIDVIYSSDLARALQTALILSKFHYKSSFKIKEELRERDYKEYTWLRISDFPRESVLQYFETNQELYLRVKKLYDYIRKKYTDNNVLIVAHGWSLRALLLNIFWLGADEFDKMKKFSNCWLSIIDINWNDVELVCENDIFHLEVI